MGLVALDRDAAQIDPPLDADALPADVQAVAVGTDLDARRRGDAPGDADAFAALVPAMAVTVDDDELGAAALAALVAPVAVSAGAKPPLTAAVVAAVPAVAVTVADYELGAAAGAALVTAVTVSAGAKPPTAAAVVAAVPVVAVVEDDGELGAAAGAADVTAVAVGAGGIPPTAAGAVADVLAMAVGEDGHDGCRPVARSVVAAGPVADVLTVPMPERHCDGGGFDHESAASVSTVAGANEAARGCDPEDANEESQQIAGHRSWLQHVVRVSVTYCQAQSHMLLSRRVRRSHSPSPSDPQEMCNMRLPRRLLWVW